MKIKLPDHIIKHEYVNLKKQLPGLLKKCFTGIICLFCISTVYGQSNTSFGEDALSQSQVPKYRISHIEITNPGSYSRPTVNFNVSAPVEVLWESLEVFSQSFWYESEIRSATDLGNFTPTLSGGHQASVVYSWVAGGYYYYFIGFYGGDLGYYPQVTLSSGSSNLINGYFDENYQLQIDYYDSDNSNLYTVAPSVHISFGGATAVAVLSTTAAVSETNTAIGYQSQMVSVASKNTSLGAFSMKNNTGGRENVAIGNEVLLTNISGTGNVASGYRSMYSNISGSYNTASGYRSLYSNNGMCNTAYGYESLYSNTAGYFNTASGYKSMYRNTTGYYNIASGYQSMYNNTTGYYNIAIGLQAGYNVSTGSHNIFIGNSWGGITTGSGNTFVGGGSSSSGNISNTVIISDGTGNQRFYSPASGNIIVGRGNNPTDQGYKFDVGGTGRFAGVLTLAAEPATSTGVYNVLTRNSTTGAIEKINVSFANVVNTTDNQDISGNKFFMGSISIGTSNATEKLSVNGNIKAKGVKVMPDPNAWPDYVFESQYQLPTLQSIEHFIKEKGHLPDIPSAAQVAREGVELGELGASLLKKIEELTLHLIQKDKELTEANRRIDALSEKIEKLKP